MARKKYDEDPENQERWFISYADFITLLFAFFVVMYAISSVNQGKYRVLSDSLGTAFGKTVLTPALIDESQPGFPIRPDQIPGLKARASEAQLRRERTAMSALARDLQGVLAPLVREGKVRVTQTGRGVSVEINASVLFDPGEARLTGESSVALRAVATLLKDDVHAIQVEGHTDNVPIKNVTFPSNWELSAVRASSVVRLFIENGIAEARLSAVGHGPNQPVASNDTLPGRARNRRVAVTILSGLPEPVIDVTSRAMIPSPAN